MHKKDNKLDAHGESGGEKLREDGIRDNKVRDDDNTTHFHAYTHPEGKPGKGEFSASKGRKFEMKEGRN